MNDMSSTIIPKSDQLNADDLIGGPITVKITAVKVTPGVEQPAALSFEGDKGKPYKPCKSMCRVLVMMWGKDANKYVGKSLTLYRDPTVKWAGLQVGGIRISHMSDIEKEKTMALTETKQSRKPFTVRPLVAAATAKPPAPASEEVIDEAALLIEATAKAKLGTADLKAWWATQTKAKKVMLEPYMERLKAAAAEVDAADDTFGGGVESDPKTPPSPEDCMTV